MGDPLYVNRGFGLGKVVGGEIRRDYRSALVDRMRAEGFRLPAGDLTFVLPREFGFCYGVDRAIEYAYETRERFPDRRVFLVGEMIHNPRVNDRLVAMGIRFLEGGDLASGTQVPGEGDVVIVPAFGLPAPLLARLKRSRALVVDTTCGSVLNVWKNVERYARDGFTSLIHGKFDHEETRATASRALLHPDGRYIVVRDVEEARLVAARIERRVDDASFLDRFAGAVAPDFDPERDLARVGCANQTTMLAGESMAVAAIVRDALVRRFGEDETATRFRAFDTICSATQDRQDALEALIEESRPDVVLVVGGYNSSNTGHLLEIVVAAGVAGYHVSGADGIEEDGSIRHQPVHRRGEARAAAWLPAGPVTVGVTSGASTPDGEVEAIIRRVCALRAVTPD